MADDWLDSWTKVRRLPKTFEAAKRWATRRGHSADLRFDDPAREPGKLAVIPYADSMYILRHGKKAWRAMKAASMVAPNSVPVEYSDPDAQAAFEAVYRNRLHMLRVDPGGDGQSGTAD